MSRLTTKLLIAALLLLPAAGATRAADATALPLVRVVAGVERELVAETAVTGAIVARDEVLVAAELDGVPITELLVEEGDRVTAGQPLARLSRDLLAAQLASADATLERVQLGVVLARASVDEVAAQAAWLQSEVERAQRLARSSNVALSTLEQREAERKGAEARMVAARQGVLLAEAQVAEAAAKRNELLVKLAKTEIKAPVGGIVSQRRAKQGMTVTAMGEPLFRIIEQGEVELRADVAETVLARLAVGQKVRVTPNGSEQSFTGPLRLIAPSIDPPERLAAIRVALDGQPRLTIGLFARARIETARARGVAVPTSGVQVGEGGATVQLVRGDQIETRDVRLGLRTDELTIVAEGLSVGERIVALSGSFLRPGDRVRPVDIEP